MSDMMKCFVMHGIGKVGVMEKPIPRPGPNDAIIRTTATLICTSDTHTVAGAIGDRQGLTLGHEAVGVVHELGEVAAASGLFHVGQRVAVSAITPCYACDNCQRGYPSQCGGMLGGWKFANLKDGSFAEYFHVNNAVACWQSCGFTTTDGLRPNATQLSSKMRATFSALVCTMLAVTGPLPAWDRLR